MALGRHRKAKKTIDWLHRTVQTRAPRQPGDHSPALALGIPLIDSLSFLAITKPQCAQAMERDCTEEERNKQHQ